jgi:hypothetical protein
VFNIIKSLKIINHATHRIAEHSSGIAERSSGIAECSSGIAECSSHIAERSSILDVTSCCWADSS